MTYCTKWVPSASSLYDKWKDVKVPGTADGFNPELDKAGRVADFLELGELFARDALERNESCGGHFREESQTDEGEAMRDDDNYMENFESLQDSAIDLINYSAFFSAYLDYDIDGQTTERDIFNRNKINDDTQGS